MHSCFFFLNCTSSQNVQTFLKIQCFLNFVSLINKDNIVVSLPQNTPCNLFIRAKNVREVQKSKLKTRLKKVSVSKQQEQDGGDLKKIRVVLPFLMNTFFELAHAELW